MSADIEGSDTEQEDCKTAEASATELMQQVGARIQAIRKSQDMSRLELSQRSSVSLRYLAKLEGGDGNVSLGVLTKVALALGIPAEHLLQENDPYAKEIRQISDLYHGADAAARARVLRVLAPERLKVQKAKRLCLVGLRGAGKSTLGALISAHFDAPFIELNTEIANNAGMPIGEIIALYDQEGYRQLEAETLTEITDKHRRVVVAVGGGLVSEEDTFYHVLSRFHTVWVKTSAAEHMERVRNQGDMRPMAGDPRAMIQLRKILKSREEFYSEADHQLDTSGKSVETSHAELTALVYTHKILGAAPF